MNHNNTPQAPHNPQQPQNPFGQGNPNANQGNQYGQPGQHGQPGQLGQQNPFGQGNPNVNQGNQFGQPGQQQNPPGQYGQPAPYGQTSGPEKKSPVMMIVAILGVLVLFLGIGFAYNSYKNSDTEGSNDPSNSANAADSSDTSGSAAADDESTTLSSPGSESSGSESSASELGLTNDFAVGDCFAQPGHSRYNPNATRVQQTDCDDSSAVLEALSAEKKPSDKSCLDTAGGVTTLANSDGTVLCLGEKKVDPDSTINLAKAGDCIKEAPGKNNSGFETVDCSDGAGHEVIATIDKGPGRDESIKQEHFRFCDEAGATNANYLFTLYVPVMKANGGQTFDVRTYCAS